MTATLATIDDRKKELRRDMMQRRVALFRALPDGGGTALRDRFLAAIPLPPKGAVVSAFWPMGEEINVRPLLDAMHERRYRCCLPVVVKRGLPLVFREWTPQTMLVAGGFGVSVPPPASAELVPDLLIVPLLAFDRTGHRLGYGAGFYDRSLAKLRASGNPLAVGVAFAGQEVPGVPHDDSDARLDWIVTEGEAFRAKEAQ